MYNEISKASNHRKDNYKDQNLQKDVDNFEVFSKI